MIKLTFNRLVLLIFINLALSECKKLPSLWEEDGKELKSYRIMAELEITQSGKVSAV